MKDHILFCLLNVLRGCAQSNSYKRVGRVATKGRVGSSRYDKISILLCVFGKETSKTSIQLWMMLLNIFAFSYLIICLNFINFKMPF